MPELPEVETVCQGLSGHLIDQTITRLVVRQPSLRWPVLSSLPRIVKGATIGDVFRRAKYLIIATDRGHILIHLGMSGSLRLCNKSEACRKHDHVDFHLSSGHVLRFHDPRRFGAILWSKEALVQHPRLMHLGPEPLSRAFSAKYIYDACQGRSVCIKTWLMNQKNVVGVGNIYASEALFLSKIHPLKQAKDIGLGECKNLSRFVKQVLREAIKQGGTTLRDFSNGHDQPGYFQQSLRVYAKVGEPCCACQTIIEKVIINQRASYYCPGCQPGKV